MIYRVPTAQGKQGKWPKIFPVRENTGNLEILSKHREFCQNTGNFVSSSCKSCSDSKSKGHCNICRKKKSFFSPQKLDRSAKSVLCM